VETRLIHDMLDRGVDGFLYATMYTRQVRPSTALRGHPVVLLNCVPKNGQLAAVVPDEIDAGRAAVRTLLTAGHREHIYLVGETPSRVIAAAERLMGMTEGLSAEGLRFAGQLSCDWWPEPAYEAVHEFIAAGPRATAMICLNDRVALGTYQALQEAGLRVPDDMSVVSFDDSDLATWLRPNLTSIAIPHYELGRRAVERLLAGDHERGVERVAMPVRHRASVGSPRRV
jgi:LacI family transcriptional regulator